MIKKTQKVLYNAEIFSSQEEIIESDSIVIEDDSISWIGKFKDLNLSDFKRFEFIDCKNNSLLPGLIDSHLHFLAYATSLSATDCSPEIVNSIEKLALNLKKHQSNNFWVRGFGYDESGLSEQRHPNRYDLDIYFPNNPVSIKHRSGHARVLNSKALEISGIDRSSIGPMDGIIQRDVSGELTGVFFEMDEYLDSKIPHIETSELHKLIEHANNKLLSYGITTIHDCTVENSLQRYQIFKERQKYLKNKQIRMIFMPGINYFNDFLNHPNSDSFLAIGQVKIIQTNTTGVNAPGLEDLNHLIKEVHNSNLSVAIHAVSTELVFQAASAIYKNKYNRTCPLPDRIEHASESPETNIRLIAKSNAHIVSNPSFLHSSGDRFIETIASADLDTLYPFKSILDNGIPLAFGSDAPITDPNPFTGIHSAITRMAKSGHKINESESIGIDSAINGYTKNAANASNNMFQVGSIRKNSKADLILLNQNVRQIPIDELKNVHTELTLLNGEIVWSK